MRNAKIRVLYVDDEVNNLNAFKMNFRRDYEVYTATNTLDARGILKDTRIHVVIADQKMPGTTGIEFFESIKDKYPNPVRILLTGYSDMEALIEAINKGQIYHYLKKPWNDHELTSVIKNAYESYLTREKLEYNVRELERTNDELSRFIYSASHDLRAPLLSALGIIQVSKSDNSISDPNGYIPLIERNIEQVENFIEKIIEYYKNVKFRPDYERIHFKALIWDCIEACYLKESEVTFKVEVVQDDIFYGDLFRISAIFKNLISNAIKYQNPEKEPIVEISAVVNNEKAVIRVEDNGIGMLAEHLENIFDIFLRKKSGGGRKTGIGLYIVKEALNRINGKISVSSLYGKGTKFVITIPNREEPE